MVIKQITAITLRFLALTLLIKLTLNIPMILMFLSSYESYMQQDIPIFLYVGLIASFVIVGCISAYLIWKVSKSIIEKAPTNTESWMSEDNQKFLIQLGGIYFIVNALVYLPAAIGRLPNSQHIVFENTLSVVGWLIQLLIGILITTRATHWHKLLLKLRSRT
ncbi:hypothetical protein RI845_12675 [Thalassotalea nanhaiensis]|uniref:DUF2975 domain-containing protein n=1 Tax=Thalassotalea nanhaiensis TaxID=3065648 RepID=A0ABY9TG27_9GAMM|nr:hypothetical protein RI845_12675 [Colwelliaceae bacterium SQ345]